MTHVPTVQAKDIAAYLEAAAPGVDLQGCLIDPAFNLVPHGVWLWDGTAGEHHLTSEEELALLMPEKEHRDRWLSRLIKVVLDSDPIREFVHDLEAPMELRRAA